MDVANGLSAIPADSGSLEKIPNTDVTSTPEYTFLEYYYICAEDAELGGKIHFVL